ncbi:MAG: helix-turn-helix transcriptional regulator [Lachnospiraceae bacterium]|nr:helix-turn-helix transcriptional regulator [Lachnospiraceae bacterium]
MWVYDIGVGYTFGKEFEENRSNGMGFWLLVLAKNRARFEIKGEAVEIRKPSYVLLRPDTPVVFGPLRGSMVIDWIGFYTQGDDVPWMEKTGLKFDKPVALADSEELSEILHTLHYEHYLADRLHIEMEASVMRVLCMQIARLSKDAENKAQGYSRAKAALLNKLRVEIYAHPEGIGSVDDMAAKLGLSRSGLQHMYKNMFGTQISLDVITSRINYSKKLLKATKFPLREIAAMCGYQNEFYFMRQFKNVTGKTPSEYRSAH